MAPCLNPDPGYSASYNSYLLLTLSIYYTCGCGNSQGIYVKITIGRLLIIIKTPQKLGGIFGIVCFSDVSIRESRKPNPYVYVINIMCL